MARSRTRPKQTAPEVSEGAGTTTTTKKEVKNMAAESLTMEQIAELMSKSRTKGAGEKVLQAFIDSNEQGIVVDLTSGPLAGKNATSAVATLNNAKKRTRQVGTTVEQVNPQFANILIKKAGKGDEAVVALINTDLVELGK